MSGLRRGGYGRNVAFAAALLAAGCAPPGYRYETGSFTPHAIDACARPETISGLKGWLNAKAGLPGDPAARVVEIENMVSAGPGPDEGQGNSLTCRATLVLATGKRETGVVTAIDPGGAAPLAVTWRRD